MYKIIFFYIILFTVSISISAQESSKNYFTMDFGYAYSRQIVGTNLLGNSYVNSGIFQQMQYNRSLHKFFDVYLGLANYIILPTKSLVSSELLKFENAIYTERENSISVFTGFNFNALSKGVFTWKISQDIGFNYISRDNLIAQSLNIFTDSISVFDGGLFVDDEVYKSLNYGIGSSLNFDVSERLALGLIYKSNLAFNFNDVKRVNQTLVKTTGLFHAAHQIGFRIGVKF